MGTGTNIQKKLIAVHGLDIPWRPADLEQRAGRIIIQGNENKNVQIYRYVTKGTFDAYSFQTLENKQKFISQIMTSKTPARKCEYVNQQALTYSEIKALCTGDERIKEKLMLENEVKKLRVLSAEHKNTVMGGEMSACLKGAASHTTKLIESFAHNLNRLESALYNIDGRIERVRENLAKLRIDYAEAQKLAAEPFPQQEELESKEERLKTLTDELNKAAMEAKKNAPKREKTCYFERAKMKRDAMRIAKKPKQNKDKGKDKKQPDLE